ncbi:unnamed protein product [Caenorhabditis auriculariae]|uniref:Uncharacterized protein n=1 Tax=Caenorhabditis auriculariae TaxID=2777116 RepID=A0A8S1HVJ8_9PELO|nr:unnamed protein product [Caenorhabditis auriculariae]
MVEDERRMGSISPKEETPPEIEPEPSSEQAPSFEVVTNEFDSPSVSTSTSMVDSGFDGSTRKEEPKMKEARVFFRNKTPESQIPEEEHI